MSSIWDNYMLCVCTGINEQKHQFVVVLLKKRTQRRRTRYNGAVISRGSLLERRQFVRRGKAAG